MAQYVPYVVFRQVWSDHDEAPDIHGYADDSDIQRGRDWYHLPKFGASRDTDKRVILQFANEQGNHQDGNFYIGLMLAAEDESRKVGIYADPVGWTEFQIATQNMPKVAINALQSKPESMQEFLYQRAVSIWAGRRQSLIHCRDHGHYVILHVYGCIFGWHPLSAYDNEADWQWWGGRPFFVYASMPDCQPNLLLAEAGQGDANQQVAHGFEVWKKDLDYFDTRTRQYPYLKAYMDWTSGGGFDPNFLGSQNDQFLSRL
jgi:hypothetical protein